MIVEFLSDCFRSLNDRCVYAVLRNYDGLPNRWGNDIDLLVDTGSKEEVLSIVEAQALRHEMQLIKRKKRLDYVGMYFMCLNSGEVILIDVFTKLRKGWKEYFCAKSALASRKLHNNIYVVDEASELAVVVLKESLTYSRVREKYRTRVGELLQVVELDDLSKRLTYISLEHRRLVATELRSGGIFQSLNVRVVSMRLFDLVLYVLARLSDATRCAFSPIGFMALIGPDGVGKSTMSGFLQQELGKNRLFREVVVYHHRFEIIPALGDILRRKKPSSGQSSAGFGANVGSHSWLRTLAYMLYYGIDYSLGRLVLLWHKSHDRFVIFDRYAYDFFIQDSYSSVPWYWKRQYMKLLPKPFSTVFLYANPHVVVARKNEQTLESHIEQNTMCFRLLREARRPVFLNCNDQISTVQKSLKVHLCSLFEAT